MQLLAPSFGARRTNAGKSWVTNFDKEAGVVTCDQVARSLKLVGIGIVRARRLATLRGASKYSVYQPSPLENKKRGFGRPRGGGNDY